MTDYSLRKRAERLSSSQALSTVCSVTSAPDIFNSDTDVVYAVWCWGWDGAGDLDGPDVDPIWERMSNKSTKPQSVTVKHDRSIRLANGVGLGI